MILANESGQRFRATERSGGFTNISHLGSTHRELIPKRSSLVLDDGRLLTPKGEDKFMIVDTGEILTIIQ